MWSPQFSIRLKHLNPQEAQLRHREWEKPKFQPSLWAFQLKGVDELSSAQGDPSWPMYHQSKPSLSTEGRELQLLWAGCPHCPQHNGTHWGQCSSSLPLATAQGEPSYYLATTSPQCTWEWTQVPMVTQSFWVIAFLRKILVTLKEGKCVPKP